MVIHSLKLLYVSENPSKKIIKKNDWNNLFMQLKVPWFDKIILFGKMKS